MLISVTPQIVGVRELSGWKRAALLVAADPRFACGDDAVDAPIAVLTARETKGLEFDHVFVIDPDAIARQAPRGPDIYVACTRATQTLHLVTLVN